MRILKGDIIAVGNFKVGYKKIGYYFCWQFLLLADNSPNSLHTIPFPCLSLAHRISELRLTNTSTQKIKNIN